MSLTKLLVRQKLIFACAKITSSITRKKGKPQVATHFLHNVVKNENGESQSKDCEKWDVQTLYVFLEGMEIQETILNL
jgi:hypothetical protein